jgi:hypothetical protein
MKTIDPFDGGALYSMNKGSSAVEKTQPMEAVSTPYLVPKTIGNASKAHPRIAQFLNQDVCVKMMNSAFSTNGILVEATNKLVVVRTIIGSSKSNQPVVDDLVITMHNVASISRNPKSME